MDVNFVLEDEKTFCVEVGFFDSFHEIKQKIEKYIAIPSSSQTLLFHGEILQNDDVIFHTDITQHSRLKLLVSSESFPNPAVWPRLLTPLPSTLPLEFPQPIHYNSRPPPNKNEYREMLHWITENATANRGDLEELLLSISGDALPPWNSEFNLAPPLPLPTPPIIVSFTVKIVEYKVRPFSLEMDLDDTVLKLKEKIYIMKKRRNLNLNQMSVLIKSGEELRDQFSLRDCGMLNVSVVYVRRKPPKSQPSSTVPVVTANGDGASAIKIVKVTVVPKDGTEKILIEVNSFNRVEDLRYELEKFHKRVLPENDRYFFINKKNGHVMTETHAFNWYDIQDGDVIEIIPEYVSD